MNLNSSQAKNAFTLIELLIVVAIIGILAAIAVPNFLNAQTRAKISRVAADQKSLATALEQYRLDNGTYPPDAISRNPIGLYMLTTPVSYIQSIPIDPFLHINNLRAPIEETTMGPFFEMGTDTEAEHTRGTYLLAASGPDNDDDSGGITSWPSTVFWDFDPSNGLHSNGDINRIGGTYNHGNYIRNGKPNR